MTATLPPQTASGHHSHEAHAQVAAGPHLLADHGPIVAQRTCVGEVPNFPSGHRSREPQRMVAAGDLDRATGQRLNGTHPQVVGGAHTPEPAIHQTTPIDVPPVRVPTPSAPAKRLPEPIDSAPVLADPLLALAADVLDDLERVRIANENRLRQLTRDETDADGEERGFGLTLDHPDVARLAALVDGLAKAEHQAELNLKRQLRAHPLGPWVKQARGVGEKQAARLLAAIGDPYWNDLYDRPRTVSELWAYAGYHVLPAGQTARDTHRPIAGGNGGHFDHLVNDSQGCRVGVAATRSRGQKANWSATAKMRAHLVATSIVKAGGPYREVYDQGRAKYADATHKVECKRCGPTGKPAQPGSALSAGHQHARALRLVAKAVLKDLWLEAKRLHELPSGLDTADAHIRSAAGVPDASAGHPANENQVLLANGGPT